MVPRKNPSSSKASSLLVFNQGKFQLFLHQIDNFSLDWVFCEWIPPGKEQSRFHRQTLPLSRGSDSTADPVRKWVKLLRSRGLPRGQRPGLCQFPSEVSKQSKFCRSEVSMRKISFEHVTQAQTHGLEADGKDWFEHSMWWRPEVPPRLNFQWVCHILRPGAENMCITYMAIHYVPVR